jgi:hypothetical protein
VNNAEFLQHGGRGSISVMDEDDDQLELRQYRSRAQAKL